MKRTSGGVLRCAGIDLSTHAVDLVTVPLDGNGPPVWHRYPLEGTDSFTRARRVRDAMPPRTSELYEDCLAIGIEDPAGHHGTNHIYRIQGAVLQCLPALVLVQQWRPAAWRKTVGLKGNCSKDEVRQWCWGQDASFTGLTSWDGPPQDACDAFAIALATRAVIRVGAAA